MFRERCHPRPRVAVETTGATWAFVDALQPTGATVCVVDPRETRLKAGFAAKTDRLDARRLADALRRDSVVSVFLPPPAIRELREVCRGRHQLVRIRSRLAQNDPRAVAPQRWRGAAAYRERSVMNRPESVNVPLLIIHGAGMKKCRCHKRRRSRRS
jgi:Transposase